MRDTEVYIPPVFELINRNIAERGNPLGLKGKDCVSWAGELQIPGRGETIFYTGCEYQMTAYLRSLSEVLKRAKFEDSLFSAFQGFQKVVGKLGVDLTKAYAQVAGSEKETYERLLRMAAQILQRLGVDFAYLGERELYSGALLYEYGLFEEFERQARRVANLFRDSGAKRIIALTPHSAEIFRQVYPRFVNNFDFEVVPYVSVVAEAWKKSGMELSLSEPMTLTLHDPCHLARSLKVTEPPREVLCAIKNLEFREVSSNRESTVCCGAPCETVYPELAELVASRRVQELAATGAGAVATLCPFCHASLSRAARSVDIKLKIVDFVEIVYQALEGKHA